MQDSTQMNPEIVKNDDGTYQEGTGAIGGWEKCDMRTYLKETIKPLIPDNVRNSIKEVTKKQIAWNVTGSKYEQTTTDDVWVPSANEIENESCIYGGFFPDNASRIRYSQSENSSPINWWLRSADSYKFMFSNVGKTGDVNKDNQPNYISVILCFCT
jgi:hypothetical protein